MKENWSCKDTSDSDALSCGTQLAKQTSGVPRCIGFEAEIDVR